MDKLFEVLPRLVVYLALLVASIGLFVVFIYPGNPIELGGSETGRRDRIIEQNLSINPNHYSLRPVLGSIRLSAANPGDDGWYIVPQDPDNSLGVDPDEIARRTVIFEDQFLDVPVVILGISGFEFSTSAHPAIDTAVVAENVTASAFDIVWYGGDGARVGNMLVNYIAFPSHQVNSRDIYTGRFAD